MSPDASVTLRPTSVGVAAVSRATGPVASPNSPSPSRSQVCAASRAPSGSDAVEVSVAPAASKAATGGAVPTVTVRETIVSAPAASVARTAIVRGPGAAGVSGRAGPVPSSNSPSPSASHAISAVEPSGSSTAAVGCAGTPAWSGRR